MQICSGRSRVHLLAVHERVKIYGIRCRVDVVVAVAVVVFSICRPKAAREALSPPPTDDTSSVTLSNYTKPERRLHVACIVSHTCRHRFCTCVDANVPIASAAKKYAAYVAVQTMSRPFFVRMLSHFGMAPVREITISRVWWRRAHCIRIGQQLSKPTRTVSSRKRQHCGGAKHQPELPSDPVCVHDAGAVLANRRKTTRHDIGGRSFSAKYL